MAGERLVYSTFPSALASSEGPKPRLSTFTFTLYASASVLAGWSSSHVLNSAMVVKVGVVSPSSAALSLQEMSEKSRNKSVSVKKIDFFSWVSRGGG